MTYECPKIDIIAIKDEVKTLNADMAIV